MDCERWRESISALADGEDPGLDVRLIDAHLLRCADCRAFRDRLPQPRVALQLRAADDDVDRSRSIATQVARADRARHPLWLRAALAATGVSIIVYGSRALVLGDAHGSSHHAARHLGAFTVAYGIGLLAVVVRPAKARAFLPVAAVVAGGLVITAIVDVTSGTVPLVDELKHVVEIVSVALVWLLAPHPPRRPAEQQGDTERPPIRLVEPDRRVG